MKLCLHLLRFYYDGLPHYHKTNNVTPVCARVGHYNLYRFLGTTPGVHTHAHTHLEGGGIDFTQKALIQSYLLELPTLNALIS